MFSLSRLCFILFFFSIVNSCGNQLEKNKELLFWCSNNNQEIKLSASITDKWNQTHPANSIHLQPVPEGQSSEEVILAAVVGKCLPSVEG